MQVGPDAATATAAEGAEDGREALLVTLRWVHPADNRVTILTDRPALLGRDASSVTRLETAQVSRQHAELVYDGESHRIRDLGSKNGVFVNGERVRDSAITSGDVIRLGDAVAVVETITRAGLPGFGEIVHGIFGGALMRRIVARARTVAASSLNVVLLGETGTGKECLARALHAFSGRRGPFLAVNSAAYDANTAGAELFGYKKGAFTGAESAHIGHLRAADGGTLFLDEVLELTPAIQAKLLRAIEQKEVLSLGETRPRSVDVRFVSASQAPLASVVRSGAFRSDLRARLEGAIIELPNLCARRGDVVPLFLQFLARHGAPNPPKLEPKLVERLCLYDWPMNVREVENMARRVVTEHGGRTELGLELLRDCLSFDAGEPCTRARDVGAPSRGGEGAPLRRAVPAYTEEELGKLRQALDSHRGSVTRAAEELGISRPRIYRMLRALEARP